MIELMKAFAKEELGQDFVEHALILAMIALTSAALFFSSGSSISGVWSGADSKISVASRSAGS